MNIIAKEGGTYRFIIEYFMGGKVRHMDINVRGAMDDSDACYQAQKAFRAIYPDRSIMWDRLYGSNRPETLNIPMGDFISIKYAEMKEEQRKMRWERGRTNDD